MRFDEFLQLARRSYLPIVHRGASSAAQLAGRGAASVAALASSAPLRLARLARPQSAAPLAAPEPRGTRRSVRSLWPAPRGPIGIDIGGRYVKAVQLTRGRRASKSSDRTWHVAATADFLRGIEGAPLSRAEVFRIAEVLRRRSFSGNQVVLTVPDGRLVAGPMELPPRGAGVPLDAVARVEFSRAYKCEPDSFEMAYWDLPTAARAAKTTNVMAVACPHADAEALIDLFAAAGLEVIALEARPCSMARACAPLTRDADGIVLLLEIGWNSAALVVLHRGVIVYERAAVEAGIRQLHADLLAALHVAPDIVDAILTDAGIFGTTDASRGPDYAPGRKTFIPAEVLGEVRAIVAAHFERTARELMASVSYSSHQYPDAPVSRLVLLGGGALLPGLPAFMQERLGFECRVAAAPIPPGPGHDRPACTAAMATAAGLAQFVE
jgi:Tfp pilus assembly PilM family ATPase